MPTRGQRCRVMSGHKAVAPLAALALFQPHPSGPVSCLQPQGGAPALKASLPPLPGQEAPSWLQFLGEQAHWGHLLGPQGSPSPQARSPGLSERMACRIMTDITSLRSSLVLGRHQPSRSVQRLSAPSLR